MKRLIAPSLLAVLALGVAAAAASDAQAKPSSSSRSSSSSKSYSSRSSSSKSYGSSSYSSKPSYSTSKPSYTTKKVTTGGTYTPPPLTTAKTTAPAPSVPKATAPTSGLVVAKTPAPTVPKATAPTGSGLTLTKATAPKATVTPVKPSPTATKFASSPQAKTYQRASKTYSLSSGTSYKTKLKPLSRDPHYGNLSYGRGYHYGRYDYFPVYAAGGVLTYLVLADEFGNQRQVNCDYPQSQYDYDACASARSQVTRVSNTGSYAQPVRQNNGIGFWGFMTVLAVIGAIGVGVWFFFFRK